MRHNVRLTHASPAETALFSLLLRTTVLLVVCLTQSWLLWKFIRFQLRRWREFRHEQATRKKATKQALRPLKRDSSKFRGLTALRPTGGKSKANVPADTNVSPNSRPPRERSPQGRERRLAPDQKAQIPLRGRSELVGAQPRVEFPSSTMGKLWAASPPPPPPSLLLSVL